MSAPMRSRIRSVIGRMSVVGLGLAALALVGCANDQTEARGLAGESSFMRVCFVNNSTLPVPVGLYQEGDFLLTSGSHTCAQSEGAETTAVIGASIRAIAVVLPHDNLPAGPINAEVFAQPIALVSFSAGQTTTAPNVRGLTLSCKGDCVNVTLTLGPDFR